MDAAAVRFWRLDDETFGRKRVAIYENTVVTSGSNALQHARRSYNNLAYKRSFGEELEVTSLVGRPFWKPANHTAVLDLNLLQVQVGEVYWKMNGTQAVPLSKPLTWAHALAVPAWEASLTQRQEFQKAEYAHHMSQLRMPVQGPSCESIKSLAGTANLIRHF